ncbi:hypothetical protein BKD09_00830 [Bradyrhizobium japonicum]|uniref:Haloacid dehalogenase n=1 Tax=Bradyrhizobium japonicum TaxID=375 RepID=A0A1L3F0N7_BRAJP|nr:HAD family hydrolase [Bradyrhizobium japonicum]APG06859.1 hypothetical protein BKD09_00830 [Bradyrhizobium japonicum]
MDPWVIFDADNTLWATESLYDEARHALVQALVARGVDPFHAEEVQQSIDKELYGSLGYSSERFPTSFERTLVHFLPDSSEEDRARVKAIAQEVFVRPASAHHSLEIIIQKLSESYRLGILTAGERWVQQQRLRHFSYTSRFDAIEIVDRKDSNVFVQFSEKHSVDRRVSWVVGDSLRSDVIPARLAGFNAILLDARNWDRIEMSSLELPPDVFRTSDLLDVLSIIPLQLN